ncbi:unnamed protein product [Orchesella dallaii]|uniref:Uncharacterized protein n=1 Tax=Orchesella dallaii TaxID=48710 RepID=A0ABP1R6G2_9HEXA
MLEKEQEKEPELEREVMVQMPARATAITSKMHHDRDVCQQHANKREGTTASLDECHKYITSWSSPMVKRPVESILLLSAFKVNVLMRLLWSRVKDGTVVTLHMFAGRYTESQGILVICRAKLKLWLHFNSLLEGDPSGMVRAILKFRNDVLRDSDHTVR